MLNGHCVMNAWCRTCAQNVYSVWAGRVKITRHTHTLVRFASTWAQTHPFVPRFVARLAYSYSHSATPNNTLLHPFIPAIHTPYINNDKIN